MQYCSTVQLSILMVWGPRPPPPRKAKTKPKGPSLKTFMRGSSTCTEKAALSYCCSRPCSRSLLRPRLSTSPVLPSVLFLRLPSAAIVASSVTIGIGFRCYCSFLRFTTSSFPFGALLPTSPLRRTPRPPGLSMQLSDSVRFCYVRLRF